MSIEREPSSTGLLFKLAAPSICLLLAACQQTTSRADQPAATATPAAAYAAGDMRSSAAAGTAAPSREYRILPQDMLEVSVYQVPALNRTAQVDGTGHIALPLIGGVKAGGRTARELEADIAAKLGAKYLKSPQVTVFVKDALGQRVTIDGAVRKPGVYSANTLLQAMAQAGGVDELGDRDSVTVFRVTDQQRTGERYSLDAIRAGRASDPPVYGGDTIIVDESGARVAWRAFKDVAGAARMVPGL